MKYLIVPGRPIPYVRMTGRGKFVKKNAQRYLDYKNYIGFVARSQMKEPLDGNIKIEVKVFLYGKSTPMGMDGDIDNYLKTACDGLNKIAFKDDRQVVYAVASKEPCIDGSERMEIKVEAAG